MTSATVVIFGSAVRDPVQLLSQLKQPVAVCISLFGESACQSLLALHITLWWLCISLFGGSTALQDGCRDKVGWVGERQHGLVSSGCVLSSS